MNENESKQYRSLIMEEAHKARQARGDSRLKKGDTTNAAQAISDALGLGLSGSEFLSKVFSPTLHKEKASMLPFPRQGQASELTPEQILQDIEQKHAEEMKQVKLQIAEMLKKKEEEDKQKPSQSKSETWQGNYVYVYFVEGGKRKNRYLIRSRRNGGRSASHHVEFSAFDNFDEAARLAQKIDNFIFKILQNMKD